MKEIHFRTAIKEDLPVLYQFEQGIITAERPYDETLKLDPITYYDLNAMICSNDAVIIVALDGEKIIGSAYGMIKEAKPYLKHSHYAYLGFMYVNNDYRGKGINKQIIEELKTWTLSKNIYELRLDVYNDNISAIKAYEKAGFQKHLVNMRMDILTSPSNE